MKMKALHNRITTGVKENSCDNDVFIPAVGALSQSQVHPLLGSLPLPGRPLQPPTHAQLEHFLPLRVNSSSPLSLFPNFNTMDPVQKAVINHTFGVAPPKKKPIISCNICHLRFNSTVSQTLVGSFPLLSLRKNVLVFICGYPFCLCSSPSFMQSVDGGGGGLVPHHSMHRVAKRSPLHIELRGCTVYSVCLETGTDNLSNDKLSNSLEVKMTSSPRPTCRIKQRMGSKTRAVVGVSSQPFHCEMCQVSVNSETQLKQHMNSRRHKERLAGKPVKVKFTPYNKLQPSAILATKLALQKQLSKALPAGFLTGPLNPAALCTMASGPLALRLPPGPAAFIQGPLISPTLFRPAPGPLRATHTPIIFSPY
uniref:Zinc finger protein 385B n=1 Tax=Dicentrarchus labrax TaxID=13489 RepID=E6ZHD8_DICLA|nr:Zinc finger protein 385B [Dicentrarchus labrax]